MKCVPWILAIGLFACNGDKNGTVDATGDTGDTDTTDTDLPIDTDLPVDTDLPDPLAIVGSYTDAFGTEHVIDDGSWTQTFPGYPGTTWTITSYDNDGMFLVAQNSPSDPFNPDLWSRFDWVGDLYYCQAVFDAATEAEAAATPRPDDADLAGGCGGFGWTDLTP